MKNELQNIIFEQKKLFSMELSLLFDKPKKKKNENTIIHKRNKYK